jgi:hypothetical protein
MFGPKQGTGEVAEVGKSGIDQQSLVEGRVIDGSARKRLTEVVCNH